VDLPNKDLGVYTN